ncbi:Endonuclease/exonuclease/phosphatase [Mycena pura]|uniref:Endonuclease/exonuclease/phosphatase n=1 Tax=Mycena pura TaxID=153505 RepID=A0AAD6VS72_9AGAR|nr:Endonuclease/exonuclease/phosphatase [Mycena pura]
MNGLRANSLSQSGHKWHEIHSILHAKQLGILIVTETHMSTTQVQEINASYMNKRLKLFNYKYPDNPATKGVVIVLNREITNIEGVGVHYLIPGQAMLAIIPWHGKKTLTVLASYAAAETDDDKIRYWDELCNLSLTLDLPVPDVVGGDFNLVTSPLDRLPHRMDPDAVVATYLRFAHLLELKDGWHSNNPDAKAYTHLNSRGTMSRIDWLLVSPTLMKNCCNWEISNFSGSLADHKMVSVRISAPGTPYIGKGRWAMPQFLLYDKDFMAYANKEACKPEDAMDLVRTDDENAQTRCKTFKDNVQEFAKKRVKLRWEQWSRKRKFLKERGMCS